MRKISWLACFCLLVGAASAADHGDTPILGMIGRTDAQITDLHAFIRGDDLVLALCTNPMIPRTATSYRFAPDFTATFFIDHHSVVQHDDLVDELQFGGTIMRPAAVVENVKIEVTFDDEGQPHVNASGLSDKARASIKLFTGLRDDPFIRRPRNGRNVGAIVIQLPVAAVLGPRSDLLIWAKTEVPDIDGPIGDHAGRPLRSMFNEPMNSMSPRDHWRKLETEPDAIILNVLGASGFPNGRELSDDVIDLVVDIPAGQFGDENRQVTDTNDVPFLPEFPYLAAPHAPPAP